MLKKTKGRKVDIWCDWGFIKWKKDISKHKQQPHLLSKKVKNNPDAQIAKNRTNRSHKFTITRKIWSATYGTTKETVSTESVVYTVISSTGDRTTEYRAEIQPLSLWSTPLRRVPN